MSQFKVEDDVSSLEDRYCDGCNLWVDENQGWYGSIRSSTSCMYCEDCHDAEVLEYGTSDRSNSEDEEVARVVDQFFIINIKTLAGKEITFCVDASTTIDNVKAKIFDKEGIPTYQQHLFLKRVELGNGLKFSDYLGHLQNGSTATLNFIWRGSGGGTY